MLQTPVVIIIYKRIDNLEEICSTLRKVKPKNILIISDGAKIKSDIHLINEVRSKLESLIDWKCNIHKNYAATNLGLKERFSSGISWVFSIVDRAIFIEDDCIPDPTFFRFCDELLEKYKDDKRIMTISGNNFQYGKNPITESYYFSRYPHIWGWATWKRALKHYDPDLNDWPTRRKTNWLHDVTHNFVSSKYWQYIFDKVYEGKINTWDYQLTYACFANNGLNIIPSHNLVTNVGYDNSATNTKVRSRAMGQLSTPIDFPLVHPRGIEANQPADATTDRHVFLSPIGVVSLVVKSILGIL